MLIRIILFVSLMAFSFCDDEYKFMKSPLAEKGVLNLLSIASPYNNETYSWDFEENGSVSLAGEWELYWNELPLQREEQIRLFQSIENSKPNFINLPSVWNDFSYKDSKTGKLFNLPVHGHATYRLRVILPPKKTDLSLQIGDIGMAYSLFVNGELVHQIGRPGKSHTEMDFLLKYTDVKIQSLSNELEILFLVSNYEYIESGMWGKIKLGKTSQLLNARTKERTLDLIVLGSLLIMGFYHLVFYQLRKEDKSPLFLGVFCLLIALRITVVGERHLMDWFPSLSFFTVFKIDFFTFYSGIGIFSLFLYNVYREEFHKKILIIVQVVSLSASLIVILFPISIYPRILYIMQFTTICLVLYSIYVLIKAVINRRTGAIIFLAGAIPFCFSVINDIAYAGQKVQTFYMASYGLLLFIFSQSIVISQRFSSAFHVSKKLSKELQTKSDSLEKTNLALFELKEKLYELVEERTNELEKSKKEIETLNNLSRAINENLDLGQIMGKVMEFVSPNFNIENYGLYLTDKNGTWANCVSASFFSTMTEEEKKYLLSTPITLKARRGIHARVFNTKKIIHFSKIPKSEVEAENRNSEMYKMKSFVAVPLILHGEVIGILDFFSTDVFMTIGTDAVYKLSILSDQIVGAIYNARLLKETVEAKKISEQEKQRSENLLLNILPHEVAEELKEKGSAEPVLFEFVSVLFTDFKGFTKIAEKMSPNELIRELDACFVQFDKITERFNMEKLKTIGDSYMCAGGIPKQNNTNPVDAVLAALEIQAFMNQMKEVKKQLNAPYWELRIGIHTGPLVAGVIGEKKFAYDVWGDTVNTASRMESSGTPGMINISGPTYEKIVPFFECEYRGRVNAKNKGEVDMYYVLGIKKELSENGEGKHPNYKFKEMYKNLFIRPSL